MAKRYNYVQSNGLINNFGVELNTNSNEVVTLWKVPTKYIPLAKILFNMNLQDVDGLIDKRDHIILKGDEAEVMYIKFIDPIDFDGLFHNLEGSDNYMLYEVMTRREEALNEAAYEVVRRKEKFSNNVRAQYYLNKVAMG